MNPFLPDSIVKLQKIALDVTTHTIAPKAAETDQTAQWPEHSLRALADAGLLGLHVPKRLGGHEQGLLALTVLGETIAQGCTSSALCYAMHCVGTAVIAAKATPYHEENYLIPIGANQHITTLALSERGTGAHFYLPQTQLEQQQGDFILQGEKHFVTNGGHADSYVVSTLSSDPNSEAGEFSCLVVDQDTPGIEWLDAWQGMGMRGNSSRAMKLANARVPCANLLGAEGDQIWYTFEVVAPYFLMAMAGSYLGVAQAALNIARDHIKHRHYTHSHEGLADIPTLQYRIAEMEMAVQKSRGLIFQAAYLGDTGAANATAMILMAKADAADLAVYVTNEALTCCGGLGYRENGDLSRLLRDARAAHVMAPTTDILKIWSGRLLLDLPLI